MDLCRRVSTSGRGSTRDVVGQVGTVSGLSCPAAASQVGEGAEVGGGQ